MSIEIVNNLLNLHIQISYLIVVSQDKMRFSIL